MSGIENKLKWLVQMNQPFSCIIELKEGLNMEKKNNKNNKELDKDVELTRMLTSATIQSGTVEYTHSKVGGLKKKLVDSIMRMIGSSISSEIGRASCRERV